MSAKDVLERFDTWKFAAGVAFVAIAFLALFSIKLWVDLDQVVEQRLEEARAADRETVNRCFSSAAQGPALRRVLAAVERETTDPVARADLREFRRLNAINTPTIRECRQLAERLNVPVPRGVGG